MNRNNWTVIFLPGDVRVKRQYTLSTRKVRALVYGLCVAGAVVAGAVVLVARGADVRIRAAQLDQENAELKARLAAVGVQVEELDQRVVAYDEQNERVRGIAGLDGIDREVYDVGVGGPGRRAPGDATLPLLGRTATTGYLDFLERKVQLLEKSSGETIVALEANRARLDATPSIMPVWDRHSSGFGPRKAPVHGGSSNHRGIDIPGGPGERIVATADGRVGFTGRVNGLGLTVIIDHGHGFRTVYGHASRILVRRGQRVKRRDAIALVGNTGTTTGYHVHYEVHVNDVAVDPTRFFLDPAPS